MTHATAYWCTAPGRGELRREALPAPTPAHCRLRALVSGISPGTERLVGLGLVPTAAHTAMRCAHMGGAFPFPVRYGYCWVGERLDGDLAGQRVFAMHPHQDHVCLRPEEFLALPPGLPAPRATLLPNLETAQNAVWDAGLLADERVLIVGAGIVGLLLAFVLREHGAEVVLAERSAARAARAAALPWVRDVRAPAAVPTGAFAVAFHASGHGDGLQLALDALGLEGRVLELSWYGTRSVTLQLGGDFHWQRKRIVASQVGMVARSHRPTTTPRQRLQQVIALAADHGRDLDLLPGPGIPFADLPQAMAAILADGGDTPVAPFVDYGVSLAGRPPSAAGASNPDNRANPR